jgi:anti-sigma factor RsiW
MSHNGCRGETELLLKYAADGLEAADREAVEGHIEGCGPCREIVAGQRAVWAALDGWEAPPVSEDFDRRLGARIARETSWRDRIPRLFSPALIRRGLPVAAAAGLAVAAILVMNRPKPVSPAQPVAVQQVEPLRPDQVETTLQDMEMVREFSGLVQPDPDSKM